MDRDPNDLQIRRALLTVTDKTGIVELGQALAAVGAELVATGQTAKVLRDAGLKIIAIEKLSGSPEAFQGRMKTLSFPICSGILYRRTDVSDEKDVKKLSILPIDCVVANFYAFEKAAEKYRVEHPEAGFLSRDQGWAWDVAGAGRGPAGFGVGIQPLDPDASARRLRERLEDG